MSGTFPQESFLDELKQNPDRKYRIGVVARMLDLKVHVIRYWEKEFKSIIKTQKTSGGQSLYSADDVYSLLTIKDLLHSEKYSISGAKRKLKELQNSQRTKQRTVSSELLVVIKEELEDIKADLQQKKNYLDTL